MKEFEVDPLNKEPKPIAGEHIGELDKKKLEQGDSIYIYFGKDHSYVGQTNSFIRRYKEHFRATSRFNIHNYKCVVMSFGQLINQMSLDDIERQLIAYIAADGKSKEVLLDNSTIGNTYNSYPTQREVKTDFIIPFWHDLYQRHHVGTPELSNIQNSILFKYSPFHQLSQTQADIIRDIVNHPDENALVCGMAGTGKTVMLTNLAAAINQADPTKQVAVVVKSNWVKSAEKIFKAYGKSQIKVFTANKLIEESMKHNIHFDSIIVDEAHRLRRYYSKSNNVTNVIFKLPDRVAEQRGTNYDANGEELSKLISLSEQIVLLYDPSQQIRPGDITKKQFIQITNQHRFKRYELPTEYRINISSKEKDKRAFTGDNFIRGIKAFLGIGPDNFDRKLFQDYLTNGDDAYFGICDSIQGLFDYLDNMRNYYPDSINRVVGGYCRKWVSKKDKSKYDWVEDNHHWKWNSTMEDWVNRPKSENEIGSIHAVQGVDLNFVGVIIGKDLSINKQGRLVANAANYFDSYGKFKTNDPHPEEFDRFVKNIYYVLLTRGINGVRVYFEDPAVEKAFKDFMKIK